MEAPSHCSNKTQEGVYDSRLLSRPTSALSDWRTRTGDERRAGAFEVTGELNNTDEGACVIFETGGLCLTAPGPVVFERRLIVIFSDSFADTVATDTAQHSTHTHHNH